MAQNAGLIESALAAAGTVLATRYPEAACAFVAGSIMRGQGTATSDVDLVIVYDHLENARRESFMESGFPVEAFVHDPETLRWFIDDGMANGHPVLANMIATGRPIGPEPERASALQSAAAELISKGPAPLTGARRDALRYQITDLLDDLRDGRTPAEMRAIGAALYQPLADLVLLGRGKWSGKAKWVPRLLREIDPQLATGFDEAFQQLAFGEPARIIAHAEGELARHGGPFFAGDRREAPASARSAPNALQPEPGRKSGG